MIEISLSSFRHDSAVLRTLPSLSRGSLNSGHTASALRASAQIQPSAGLRMSAKR